MRKIININEGWTFQRKENEEKESIALPHTWNAEDGQDGGNDYYRGACVYTKELTPEMVSHRKNEEVYLCFYGVNHSATVWVDEKECMHHEGGYSAFRVRIDPLTDTSETVHTLKVVADNRETNRVYPQKADFTFYGGIYRDVEILKVSHSRFDFDGLKITPVKEDTAWRIHVEGKFRNTKHHSVVFTIEDTGNTIIQKEVEIRENTAEADLRMENAHLWNGLEDPYLYTMRAELKEESGTVTDEVSSSFGCRTVRADANGFYLNDHFYPLRGVSRHQDRKGKGNALSKADHEEDIQTILSMGANSIRLAHYQHDSYVYDLCDRYGLLVWAEIPYISCYMEEAEGNANQQMKELILQNYNHPCIYAWALSNEITVSGVSEKLLRHHKQLNELVKKLDSSRYTVMANLFLLETNSPLLEIPDIFAYNLYYGWYVGEMKDNDAFFDQFHQQYPNTPIGLSEYGADALIALQSPHPEKSDYTEGYQALYHEHMLAMFATHPYLWCTYVWNMFDFAADGREEANEPGVNHKGLVCFDHKTKKDAFYIYKAYWSKEPFVHVCGRRYVDRTEDVTEIKVYSNQNKVTLMMDGKTVGEKEGSHIFTFEVPISGEHHIQAISGDLKDEIKIRKVDSPNADYVLKNASVKNWFEEEGMEIKEGYYSIKDTLEDISKSKAGAALIQQMMQQMTEKMGDVAKSAKITPAMQQMIAHRSLESVLKMGGASVDTKTIVALNKALSSIPKE